jgi:hypothetical protein
MNQWVVIGLAVVSTVGGLQYLKGWAPNAKGWVWRVALLALSAIWGLVAALATSASPLLGLLYGGTVLASCQIGYEVIVKGVVGLLEAVIEFVKRKIGG